VTPLHKTQDTDNRQLFSILFIDLEVELRLSDDESFFNSEFQQWFLKQTQRIIIPPKLKLCIYSSSCTSLWHCRHALFHFSRWILNMGRDGVTESPLWEEVSHFHALSSRPITADW